MCGREPLAQGARLVEVLRKSVRFLARAWSPPPRNQRL